MGPGDDPEFALVLVSGQATPEAAAWLDAAEDAGDVVELQQGEGHRPAPPVLLAALAQSPAAAHQALAAAPPATLRRVLRGFHPVFVWED